MNVQDAKREELIRPFGPKERSRCSERVLDNTSCIYGDLKGLTGGTIQEIKMLKLGSGEKTDETAV